jgi:hypothetical protein
MLSHSRILAVSLSRVAQPLACAAWAVALLVAASDPVPAQRSPAQQAADSQFTLRQWKAAAAAYQSLTTSNPESGLDWANLGESELQLGHADDAITAFTRAEALKFRPYKSMVDQARAWSTKGDEPRVLALLQRVIDGGTGGALRPYVMRSTEFNALRSSARFTALLEKMMPCAGEPYRQFDFWVGEWEVRLANGTLAGHNVVTLEQDGCLIVEHWTAAGGGGTGSSFNYYDVRDRKWHQLYIDNSGNAGAFPAMAGTLTDGKMVMLTDDVNNTLSRWTWYVMEPGKVKQMAETSSDHGKTWQVTWNSVYTKKR